MNTNGNQTVSSKSVMNVTHFISFLTILVIGCKANICNVHTKAINSDLVNRVFCLELSINISSDIEVGYLETRDMIINVTVKRTGNGLNDLQIFRIDKDYCSDEESISQPITHDKGSTITFCSPEITSGFYETNVKVFDLFIRARDANGIFKRHACQNTDSQNYRLMSLRFPIKTLNPCADIRTCSKHIICEHGRCSYPDCKRYCKSVMHANGNTAVCDNQITLHPFTLYMNVGNFVYVPRENSICYEISTYKNRRHHYTYRNEIADFRIDLKMSQININGMGIIKNTPSDSSGYPPRTENKFLANGLTSPICESESFLKGPFLSKESQYVCLQTMPNATIDTRTETPVYYDRLAIDAILPSGKKTRLESQSMQVNYQITELSEVIAQNNAISEIIERRGCNKSCSLLLTGTGYLSCNDNKIMFIKDKQIFDVTLNSGGEGIHLQEVELIQKSEVVAQENMTTNEIMSKVENITNDMIAQTEDALLQYVNI